MLRSKDTHLPAITASHLYYIKLGRGGEWEDESLLEGVLRFGYREAPHEMCARGDWQGVLEVMKTIRRDTGAAARDVNQIRAYYEADDHSIFITFVGGLLYWCRPAGPVEVLDDRSRRRSTVGGWRNTSIGGTVLPEENEPTDVILLGPQKLSRMVLDAGLSSWLREKVS